MKHFILSTSLALSLGCAVAVAQQTTDPQPQQQPQSADGGYHHHAPNPQRQAAMLSRKLNLTSDQTQKIEPILADRDQKMQALMQNGQLTPEDRHQQMRAIHQQTEQQLSTILTADQLNQMKAMEHHGHGPRGEGNQQPEPGQAPTT